MSIAKEEILGKIRQTLSGVDAGKSAEAYAALPREYRQSIPANVAARVDLFVGRLRDYDAVVYRCQELGIADAIAGALTARGKKRMLIPKSLPQSWLPNSFRFLPGDELSYHELDSSEGVLTGCALAIAMTGTILLQHPEPQGPRALTLIPDYHLCVVFANQVVDLVPEGIRQIRESGARVITTVSGPSATADIEMTRVKGVHGPRHLDVILVEG